jgi:hypothetical protein
MHDSAASVPLGPVAHPARRAPPFLSRPRSPAGIVQELAVIVAVTGDDLLVRDEGGEARARRAVACLVAPLPGDEVLLARLPGGRLYVMAVLERERRDRTEIAVEGDLTIRGGASVSVAGPRLELRAAEGRMVFGALTALAGALVARADHARLLATSIDSVCERLSQTMQRCFRKVAERDELRAGRIDYRTDKEMCLRAENLLAGARKLVKVDGEQIHIG